MAATISPADVPTPRRGPLSFSLGGLLLMTTCLAVALAIPSWSLWDNDERWLLRVWFAGAITLGLVSRLRGKRGILAAALGGGLPPALLTLQMWHSPTRFAIKPQPWIGELGHNSVLLAFFAGAISAGLIAAVCWYLPRRPAVTGALVSILLLASLAAWWSFDAMRWHPTWIVPAHDGRVRFAPALALSSDGRRLAVARSLSAAGDGSELELWSLADGGWQRLRVARIEHSVGQMAFSPDGRELVVAPSDRLWQSTINYDSLPPLLWFDVATEASVSPRQSGCSWLLVDLRYSTDGKLVTAIGTRRTSFHDRRALTIDVASGAVLSEEALSSRTLAAVHPLGTGVVERDTGLRWMPESSTSQPPLALSQYTTLVLSPDERWLAALDLLVDVRTGLVRRLDGRVLEFAGGGKWIVALRTRDSPRPAIARLPYARHVYDEGTKVQLALIEPHSKQLVRSSPWWQNMGGVALSRDGRVLATGAESGQILIWDVPR